jgi:hypothetical protein
MSASHTFVNPIAEFAARLIVESGFADFASAKRKAASQITDRSVPMPRDEDVALALAEYLNTFADDTHAANITVMRQVALELMQQLPQLDLELVGPVASGIATEHFAIQLDCVADDDKAVNIALVNAGLDPDAHEIKTKQGAGLCYTFEFFDWPIELFVSSDLRAASRPRESKRVVEGYDLDARLNIKALQTLLSIVQA